MSALVFGPKQRILFIGDSITDCGRRQPPTAPYGNGYVSLIQALLLARYPELNLTVINHGISGNTIRDLAQRWETDVIAAQPDWLSIKIGINDVWRAVAGRAAEAVPLDEYRATYVKLIKRTQAAAKARLVLVSPYVIEPRREDEFRRRMDLFVATVQELAQEVGAQYVPVQAAFDTALATQPADFWASDRVHPNLAGHAVIARAFLRAVGYGDV